jgi:hypothetical protein
MLPPPSGRRIRVARNKAERQWLLAIGPDVTQVALKERERLAREDECVQSLQQEHDELVERAQALEAEAKALRDDAKSVNSEIAEQIREIVGQVQPFTETHDFRCEDEAIDAELAALSDNERADRLLSTRGAAHGPIRETEHGYWGDINFMSFVNLDPGPNGWTRVGSAGMAR